jgi:hypothetical protein
VLSAAVGDFSILLFPKDIAMKEQLLELKTSNGHNLHKKSQYYIELEETYGAHNYHPLDVVIERGEGVWFTTWKVTSTWTA